ncbi:MAG: hypothetical protein AB7Q97_12580 [Gammaproteobacteria bacterium]
MTAGERSAADAATGLAGHEFAVVSDLIRLHARESPRRTALIQGDRRLSYG